MRPISLRPHLPWLVLFFALLAHRASALEIPYLSGPLLDEVGLLRPQESQVIQDTLLKLASSGKAEMAVYITKSLQGSDIESFSLAVVEKWKLGKKGKDEGLLLLIAPNERRMRMEVGYGLEGDITDALTKQIQSDTIAPYFRKQRYADGILLAIERVAKKLQVDLEAPVANRISSKREMSGGQLLLLILLFGLFLFILFISSIFQSPYRRYRGSHGGGWGSGGGGSWGGGSFGGGFGGGGFGGGGGGFGGGGSSSSW